MEFILYFLLIGIGVFVIGSFLVGWWLSGPAYKGPSSDHFDGTKFINIGGAEAKGFKELFKYFSAAQKRPKWHYTNAETRSNPVEDFTGEGSRIYFINHSTFLIQINGQNILTDPIWSKFASPFQFAGPRRMRPPGIDFEALPRIDVILLSHNHYDHLDLPYLNKLKQLYDPEIFCPLGVDLFLRKKGFTRIQVMDWWDKKQHNDLSIICTPAQHFSARGIFDRDKTLWSGFVVAADDLKIYFAGDTGYGPIFEAIGNRLGPFDASIIPIGAYKPNWFMSPIHCDPKEAIQIHHEVKSKLSIASHHGTFPLATDGQTEPTDVMKSLPEYKPIDQEFIILPEGEFKQI